MGPISMATPAILAEFPLSVGYVESFATVEIVDEHNNALPDGQHGEIRIKIDGMPDGYFAEPASDTGKFRNGWFYPNDWGYRNADGLLFISGRTDNIVNFGGHKYAPEVLEQKLVSHPSIRDAAVFLDNRSGSPGMVALIVTTAVISADELQVFGKKQLGHLAPHEYRAVELLPRNTMGKLDREKLPQMHGDLMHGDQ
jgi:acyl-coenzyme A synthetase/AMP-(fatty) acid ligase